MALTKKLAHAPNVFGLKVMLYVQNISKMRFGMCVDLHVINKNLEMQYFVVSS